MINLKNIAALISYRLSYELTKKDNARSLCLRFRCRKMTKILTRALHATRTHQAHTDKIHWSSIDGRSGYFSCFSFLSFFLRKSWELGLSAGYTRIQGKIVQNIQYLKCPTYPKIIEIGEELAFLRDQYTIINYSFVYYIYN